jgi:hypothetical protein
MPWNPGRVKRQKTFGKAKGLRLQALGYLTLSSFML